MIADAGWWLLTLTILAAVAAPFALHAHHRTPGKVAVALVIGAGVLVAATLTVAS